MDIEETNKKNTDGAPTTGMPSASANSTKTDEAKDVADASALLAKTKKADADLLAKITKADVDLLAKETKASANLLAKETKASANLLAEETKNSAEELRKDNQVYINWTKWMTIALIIVGFIQIVLAVIPLFKSGK